MDCKFQIIVFIVLASPGGIASICLFREYVLSLFKHLGTPTLKTLNGEMKAAVSESLAGVPCARGFLLFFIT